MTVARPGLADAHRIHNPGPGVALTIHVYGRDLVDDPAAINIVIAQRLSTVRQADLILVLERGQIAAAGTHDELLRTSGLYATIYEHQLKPQAKAEQAQSGADERGEIGR